MLEQRIENLENQVAKLTEAIEKLTDVLINNPPPAAAPVVNVVQDEPQPEPVQPPKKASTPKASVTQSDVMSALRKVQAEKGKDAAIGVLKKFGVTVLPSLNPENYKAALDEADKVLEAA